MNAGALVLASCFVVVGLLAAFRARDHARVLRDVRSLGAVPVADAGPGLARLHGTVSGTPLLRSPFQDRPCIYYFFRVEEPRPGKKPRTLATGKAWTSARLTDATAAVDLEPWTARVTSPRRHEAVLRGLETIPAERARFFEQAGIDEKHLPRLPLMVVHEYTLEPGDDVHALGTLQPGPDGPSLARIQRRPYVVSADPDLGLERPMRTELVLRTGVASLLLAAGAALALLGFLA